MAEIPRQAGGKFGAGNPGGKMKSAVSKRNRAIAEVCRELWDEFGTTTARAIFASKQNWAVKVRLMELIIERGYGKAPVTVKLGNAIDPNSPEGVLLRISGMNLPGAEEEEPGFDSPGFDSPESSDLDD